MNSVLPKPTWNSLRKRKHDSLMYLKSIKGASLTAEPALMCVEPGWGPGDQGSSPDGAPDHPGDSGFVTKLLYLLCTMGGANYLLLG